MYASFSGYTPGKNAAGIDFKEVSLAQLVGLTFTKGIGDALVFAKTAVALSGTGGVNIALRNGNVTGGSFVEGTGRIRIQSNYTADADTYNSDDEATTVTIDGFSNETAPSWSSNNNDLKSVTTSKESGGTVEVRGDTEFIFDGKDVKVKNVNQAAPGYMTLAYTDGGLKLDLSNLVAADAQGLKVTAAGDADMIVPPTDADGGQITIGKTTYEYTSAVGNAYFNVNGTTVTGFVLADVGDAIDVEKSGTFDIYDADDTDSKLSTISGTDYTVTKLLNGYQATVKGDSKVTIGDTTLTFTISKDTKNSAAFADGITILFDEDGEITSVDGLYDFTNSGDTMKVVGPNVTSEQGGLPVLNSDGSRDYISVSNGAFTYAGNADGEDTVTVAAGTTVYSVNNTKLLTLASDGTVTDGQDATYNTTGNGEFTMVDDEITGFTFAKAGDSIVLPTENAIPVYYNGAQVQVPAVTDSDNRFTLTMTEAGSFEISDLSADASVGRFTFTNAGGTATFDADGDISAIYGYEGTIYLYQDDSGIIINGDRLAFTFADNYLGRYMLATADTSGVVSATNLVDGDVVYSSNGSTVFDFTTDGGRLDGDTTDIVTVNGKTFTIVGDDNNVSISAGGNVEGLDQDAILQASEGPVTVNGEPYSAAQIATTDSITGTNEAVIGYEKKDGEVSSFITDYNHPIFNPWTDADDLQGERWLNTAYDQTFRETTVENLTELNRTADADTINSRIYLDGVDPDATVTAAFNNGGKNLAIVTRAARGTKNIVLGDRGDAVIMMGRDEYGTVNIVGGKGNDTIFVGGRDSVNDAVVHDVGMTTNIDLSAGGVDKVHTYAAANAKIVLNNYDEKNSYSGVVIHDPEIPYIKDLTAAIQDGLIAIDGDAIVAIDRDESSTGVDRKTRIEVNNVNAAHQSMIRLFGYKDNKDTDQLKEAYSDDFGQLLGFTKEAGGTLDASDLKEDVVLIGNKDNNKTGGSNLKGTDYDDTIFAGGSDTIDAGKGTNTIILNNDADRASATIVAGAEGITTVTNLQDGFDNDVIDVTNFAASDKFGLSFEDNVFMVADSTAKSSLLAAVNNGADFVEAKLINGSDYLNAAVAKDGGTILVTGDPVPDYYVAEGGAISFIGYNDNVLIDVDGDYETSFVGDTNVTLGSSVNTLYGGSSSSYFKGGANDETLVAGIGASSLYGGGGKNVLIGSTGTDKVDSTEFFVIGINNGAQNTISNFEFIADGGSNQATFDDLNLGMADGNEVTYIKVSGSDVVLAVKGNESGATERVTIEGAAGKEMLVDRGMQTETVAQIASNVVTVNNSYVDFYAATDDANGATVKVGNVEATEIWLGGPPIDHDKAVPEFTSSKFTVIDATGSTAQALMAGNELANTIIGGLGTASMWGGEGNANDLMVAGSGHNEFYYEIGNGNDTIQGANEGDIIHLGATLDQIDFDGTQMGAGAIVVKFTDGGTLNIESGANVTFSFDDGTAVRANRQTGQFE
ncbi:MAG: hypothetical protein IKO05_06425 [Selenomonadaceae bacterium]|nr:hypothetical protein [Selenomonadaceae bacterium]